MEIEEQAREQGWVPKAEWKGPADKWIEADTFVERGESFLPIVKANKEKAERESAELRAELVAMKATTAEFKQFQQEILDNTKRRHTEEIQRLKVEKKQAAKDGDLDAVVEISDQIEAMTLPVPPKQEPQEPQGRQAPTQQGNMSVEDQQVWDSWTGDNAWYGENPRLRAYADGYAAQIVGKYKGREFLDKMTDGVKEVFPEDFGANSKRNRRDVEGGGSGGGNPGKHTFNNLPAEAQAACRRFEKRIAGFTEAQYLADYEWD